MTMPFLLACGRSPTATEAVSLPTSGTAPSCEETTEAFYDGSSCFESDVWGTPGCVSDTPLDDLLHVCPTGCKTLEEFLSSLTVYDIAWGAYRVYSCGGTADYTVVEELGEEVNLGVERFLFDEVGALFAYSYDNSVAWSPAYFCCDGHETLVKWWGTPPTEPCTHRHDYTAAELFGDTAHTGSASDSDTGTTADSGA